MLLLLPHQQGSEAQGISGLRDFQQDFFCQAPVKGWGGLVCRLMRVTR